MIFCKLFGLIKVGRNFVFLSIQSMILEKLLTYYQMRYLGHDYAKRNIDVLQILQKHDHNLNENR